MSAFKRIMAVGCSHGKYADPTALDAVLTFRQRFKPHTVIHLGDAIDCTAFMSSHMGAARGDDVQPDVDSGLDFLRELRPNYFLLGNHEDRLERLACSKNELVSFCAVTVLSHIESFCNRNKCQTISYSGNDQCLMTGNVRWMHGTVYSENATRDHAESYATQGGVVVHAHTHRAGQATGRRHDAPIGFSVGTLTRRGALEYAKTRRATLGWSQGFVYGWVSENSSQIYLCQRQNTVEKWLLPV